MKSLLFPFSAESAARQVRRAEDNWNSRDPQRVSMAYSIDAIWRNRSQFLRGRTEIVDFLADKWERELEYRLAKELWAFAENRLAVRFVYEYHNSEGSWFRAYGNENWEFDEAGLIRTRHASINDIPISEGERKFRWERSASRPTNHPGLTELNL